MRITCSEIGYNGRLGNQLFQFAAVYGLSRDSGKKPVLPQGNTGYRLQGYGDGISRKDALELPGLSKNFLNFLGPVHAREEGYVKVREKSFVWDHNVAKACASCSNIDLHGYFQSPRYFSRYRNEILGILDFDTTPLTPEYEVVGVHVRRTDYTPVPEQYPFPGMSYYLEAMDMFPGCDFMIFSDDIPWCRNNFPSTCMFSEAGQFQSLVDMSRCDHMIMANSSFSWWGAWANRNPSKQIICPSKWFGPALGDADTSEVQSIATTLV